MSTDKALTIDAQVVVILDNPLVERDPWAETVFAEARLTPVDNGAIIKAMSKDPDAKKALLANLADPMNAQEILSPHYRKALATLYGEQPRLGIYGTAWLVHVDDVSLCVVDWSEVEKRANAPGVTEWDRDKSIGIAKDFVDARVVKFLRDPDQRYVELEPGLPLDERVAATMALLAERGLV